MPIYEYRCDACGAGLEALVPAGRADQVACRSCGAPEVRRLLSVFATPRAGAGEQVPSGGCCGGACGNC